MEHLQTRKAHYGGTQLKPMSDVTHYGGKILKVVMDAAYYGGKYGSYEKLASEVCMAHYGFKQLKPMKDDMA